VSRLRPIAAPFVVAAPAGARIRTRLRTTADDDAVLEALGSHLGALAGADLAQRCAQGRLDAKATSDSRRERKRAMTAASSSRWAGAITRCSEDAWQLARRNLGAEAKTLQSRIRAIGRRLTPAVGGRGRVRGYATRAERAARQQRLQELKARLAGVEERLAAGRVSVCRGGRSLARARHNLEAAHLTAEQWQEVWRARRRFICADGEADKAWGNETIRWHPTQGWLEIRLPAALGHLANRPHDRYRLSGSVAFSHRGDEVAAQAASGAVRYDITFDPDRGRWYLDASWKLPVTTPPSLEDLRHRPVLAVDVNAGWLAALVVDASGNPIGGPITMPLEVCGLATTTRDGHLRQAISQLLHIARASGCGALVIEDLDFAEARSAGREHTPRRPSRGRRGRRFRGLVAGIPTARFRRRLSQMAANQGLAVIAVDAAYTSRWGLEHWFAALKQASSEAGSHHAAALVIARRGLAQRARRRARCDSTPPEDGRERAASSTVWLPPDLAAGLSDPSQEPRNAGGLRAVLTRTQDLKGRRYRPGNQGVEDRSWLPEESAVPSATS
jgi:hypothetical protein